MRFETNINKWNINHKKDQRCHRKTEMKGITRYKKWYCQNEITTCNFNIDQ